MNIENMPKIELHCHLDGSVRKETIKEILGFEGDITDKVIAKEKCESLKEYLTMFDLPLKCMQTKENIVRITFELFEDMANENVKYAEVRFAPRLHMEEGLDYQDIIESVIEGIKKAEKKYDIKGNIIIIAMRHEDVEKSIEVVENSKIYLGTKVIAFDLAGNEADFPPYIHEKAINLAKGYGYRITLHAGEAGDKHNILDAIELGAERIGHGIAAKDDYHLRDLIKHHNISLEVCPTSNYQTKAVDKYEHHPIKMFLNEGIRVTVNTDNRTVSDINLTREYKKLVEKLSMTDDELYELYLNSVEASFCDEKTKKELLRKW
ncbi:MAG: adenosine deaminase [Clostridia bacterium]|jgi:adenosine deaminase|nr:adenosine deaminase [Clostridia bacterium]